MQIVIDIPEQIYRELTETAIIVTEVYPSTIERALTEGIVLPKGHGRLIDADAVTESFQTFYSSFTAHYEGDLKKFKVSCIAPTVVEADKEGVEYNNDESIAILKAMQESADAVRNSPQYDFSCVKELFDKEVEE